MALGFDVDLIGVPRFSRKSQTVTAWRRSVPWFDGWELAGEPTMSGGGYPMFAVLTREAVLGFHKRYSQRVRTDGSITPTDIEMKIVSEDDGSVPIPGGFPPPTVEEVTALLEDQTLEWVIIELWDRS